MRRCITGCGTGLGQKMNLSPCEYIGLSGAMKCIKPYFIGITGGSASGKTTIAKAISAQVGFAVPIISQDWYYRQLPDPAAGPTHNWDDPDAFDREALAAALDVWRSGGGVWTPRHDYSTYTRMDNAEYVEPARVMILEGIFAFDHADALDLCIFVECDPDIALARRIRRDVKTRGYDIDLVLDRYNTYVKPAFERWIEPAKKRADIILFNSGAVGVETHRGVDLIATFVMSKMDL